MSDVNSQGPKKSGGDAPKERRLRLVGIGIAPDGALVLLLIDDDGQQPVTLDELLRQLRSRPEQA